MKKHVSVSVVVLNYNGVEFLKEYFDSLFQQSLLPDEIIFLDNASSDDSIQFVKKYYPEVITVSNPYNAGTAEGSNIAFNYANGDYIIFQSNDIRLDKNCIKELVNAMRLNEEIGICTSVLIQYKKPDVIETAGGVMDIYGFTSHHLYQKKIAEVPDKEEVFHCYGCSFIMRKEVFEKIGGYDHRYFTLNDDSDLCWRTRITGKKVFYSKKSIVYHKGQGTLGRPEFKRFSKRFWSARNNMRTVLKNYAPQELVTKFPMYCILFFAETGYFLLRGRIWLFLANVSALFWNLFYLPETLYLRWKTQRLRRKNNINNLLIPHSLKLNMFNEFRKVI